MSDAVEVSHLVSGEGPPLYMVHGIGSRKVTWDGLLPTLEPHFTCVRFDLRGHGDSPVPPVPYTLDQLVDDLEGEVRRLLDAVGLDFHPDCPTFYESGRDARTASVDQVRQPIYRSSVRRADHYRPWLGPLLEGLGDLDALPPAPSLVLR